MSISNVLDVLAMVILGGSGVGSTVRQAVSNDDNRTPTAAKKSRWLGQTTQVVSVITAPLFLLQLFWSNAIHHPWWWLAGGAVLYAVMFFWFGLNFDKDGQEGATGFFFALTALLVVGLVGLGITAGIRQGVFAAAIGWVGHLF